MKAFVKKELEKSYEIQIIKTNPIEGGVLSTNLSLTTNCGELFLKTYRPEIADRVPSIHRVKHFFAEHDIPVILPFTTQAGKTVTAIEGQTYALFPFVQGRILTRGHLSAKALVSAGQMLAKIHLLTRDQLPDLIEKQPFGPDPNKFFDQSSEILARIHALPKRTAFDNQVVELLELKRKSATDIHRLYPLPTWGSDHLIHGDYHERNLFYDENDQITHIFDWEKTNVAPRTREFGRSLMYLCLEDRFTKQGFAAAKIFIRAYTNLYPLSQAELRAAIISILHNSIFGIWAEREHYLKGNSRPDQFIPLNLKRVRFLADHHRDFTETLAKAV